MKKHLEVLLAGLDKANKSGVFNLQESNSIIQSYSAIENKLKEVQAQEEDLINKNKLKKSNDGDPHEGLA